MCDESSVSVQCIPVRCEPQDQPPECSWPGFVPVTRPLANNLCCPETLCGEPCTPRGPAGGQRAEEGGGHRPPADQAYRAEEGGVLADHRQTTEWGGGPRGVPPGAFFLHLKVMLLTPGLPIMRRSREVTVRDLEGVQKGHRVVSRHGKP